MKKREAKTNSNNLKKGKYKREELEIYGLSKEEVEVVMQYQKQFPELLQDVDGFVIDARSLWSQLGEPQGKFADWIKRKVISKGFLESVDYEVFRKSEKNSKGGRPTEEYMLTVDTAKNVCMMENTDAGRLIRRYFIIIERAFRNRVEWNLDRDDSIFQCKQLRKAMIIYHGKLLKTKPMWAYRVEQAEFAMFNNIIIGMSASDYRKLNGLSKSASIRNTFTEEQLEHVAELEKYDADLIMVQNIFDYKTRQDILTKKYILMCS